METNTKIDALNIFYIYEKSFIDQLNKYTTDLNLWGINGASKDDELICSNDTLGLLGGSFAGKIPKENYYRVALGSAKIVAKTVSAMSDLAYDHRNPKTVTLKIESIFNGMKCSFLKIDQTLLYIENLSHHLHFAGSDKHPNTELLITTLQNLFTISSKFIAGLKIIKFGIKIKNIEDKYPSIKLLKDTCKIGLCSLGKLKPINIGDTDNNIVNFDSDSDDNMEYFIHDF